MNNKALFFTINTIIFFMLLIFVYRFVFSNSLYNYRSAKDTYLTLKSANLDLSEFDKMKQDIEDQQPLYQETFDKYQDSFITNDELIHDYEDKIAEVLKNNEILKFSKTVQYILDENEMKNILVGLNFNASYDNVYFALFDIEKFSVINKFFMLSTNDVKMECHPILHEGELDEFFMGRSGYASTENTLSTDDFKKHYERLMELNNLNIPSWKDLLPVPRNPFAVTMATGKGKALVKPKQMPAKIKNIYIEGILFEKNAPVCVIEGNLYRTGSFYKNDVRIERILKNGIIVKYKGFNYKIKTNYK